MAVLWCALSLGLHLSYLFIKVSFPRSLNKNVSCHPNNLDSILSINLSTNTPSAHCPNNYYSILSFTLITSTPSSPPPQQLILHPPLWLGFCPCISFTICFDTCLPHENINSKEGYIFISLPLPHTQQPKKPPHQWRFSHQSLAC